MQQIYVYETGSAKWMLIADQKVIFVSNKSTATHFDLKELASANSWFWEFSIYKNSLKAVPIGTNLDMENLDTVKIFLLKQRERLVLDDG